MDRYQIEICRLATNMGFTVLYEEMDDSCEVWKDGEIIASIYEDFEINPLMASFEDPEIQKAFKKLTKAVNRTEEFISLYESGLPIEDYHNLPYARLLAGSNEFYLLGADLGPFQGYVCWTISAGENPKVLPATKIRAVKRDFLERSGLVQPNAN